MKILSVRFKNLNSLRGEFFVDFNSSPLADSGLFAITGPTGAGKTTLLDAITVALYNKIPRFDKIGNTYDIMSRHTGECWSEVEFETNGKRYRSKWSVHRAGKKPEGVIQSDKMELCNSLTGEILGGHKKIESLKLVEKISGLNYEQFLRSVMLAQGEFSKFLKADAKERSELLEQMTDTFIFSRISQFVFEKTREEKKKLDDFNLLLGQFTTLTNDEIEHLKTEIDEKKELLNTLKEKELVARKHLEWWTDKQQLENEKQQLQLSFDELEKEKVLAADGNVTLDWHLKAIPHQPLINHINRNAEKIETLTAEIEKLQAEFDLVKESHSAQEKELHNKTAALKTAEEEKQKNWYKIEQTEKLDAAILVQAEQQLRIEKVTDDLTEEKISLIDELESKSKAFEELKGNAEKTQRWLIENKRYQTLEATEPAIIEALAQWKHTRQQKVDAETSLGIIQKRITDTQQHILTIGEQIKNNETASVKAKNDFDIATSDYIAWMQGKNEESLRTSLQQLPVLQAKLKSLLRLCDEYAPLITNIEKGNQFVTQTSLLVVQKEKDVVQATKTLDEAQQHLKTLEQLLEKEKLLHRYEGERLALADGDPCPLCGAIHHPFADHAPVNSVKEINDKMLVQKQKLQQLEVGLQQNRQLLETETSTLNRARQKVEMLEIDAMQKKDAFAKEKSGFAINSSITERETIAQHLLTNEKEAASIQEVWNGITQKKNAVESWKQNLDILQNEMALLVQKNQQQEQALNTLLPEEKEFNIKITKATEGFEKCRTTIDALLFPFGLEMQDDTDALITHFRKLKNEYVSQEKSSETFFAEIQLLQQKINGLYENSNALQKRITDNEGQLNIVIDALQKLQLQRIEIFGEKDTAAEKERLTLAEETTRHEEKNASAFLGQLAIKMTTTDQKVKSALQQKSELQEELELLENKLEKLAQLAGFANKTQLLTALIPVEEATRLQKIKDTLAAQEVKLQTLTQQNKKALEILCMQDAPAETIEYWQQKLEESNAETTELNRSVGGKQVQLQDDTLKKTQHAEKLKEKELQQQVYHRWYSLSSLIGSSDGTKFRNFAQGLTLSHLSTLANRHLSRFSPRYSLVKKAGDNLALEITDAWQADIARPISTLSGGETFLVSLALALGLSDLASNKVQIQSLFIDEGFGTLDAETLDVAMDALENLREAGKSIGIISHVDALKERITTQIQVQRLPGGYSRLEVKS